MLKKSKKGMVVTDSRRPKPLASDEAEHEEWHKKHGGCGNSKEHTACMKKWGIIIKKK